MVIRQNSTGFVHSRPVELACRRMLPTEKVWALPADIDHWFDIV